MKKTYTFLLIVVPLIASCTLGPDYKRPTTAASESEKFLNSEMETGPDSTQDRQLSPWWKSFGDPVTSKLVETALENNRDLMAAAARVLEAEAAFSKSDSTIWPHLDYSVSGSHTKNSFVLPGMGRRTVESTTYSAGLSLSYQLDLFGKLKRNRQAAWASYLGEEANRLTIEHSIIAAVIRSRVAVAQTRDALSIAEEIRDSWKQTLATIERRYNLGLAKAVDLYLARENLASVQATVTSLEASVKTAETGLDILLGRRPGTGSELPRTLPKLPDPGEIPSGIPIALLDRRPDLIKAEMQLAAATYGIGAALADLYPSLSLTATGGTTSDSLNNLLDTDASVYSLIGNILGPIFSGGARRASVRAARARADAAAAAYASAVLKALKEVEDALIRDQANRRRIVENTQRLENARAAARISQKRYQRGVEPFLKVLETDRRLRNAEQAMMTARVDLWNNRIDLFLALGGDWSDTETPTPATPSEYEHMETNR